MVIDDMYHHGSQTGALCYDHCGKGKAHYYWCNTAQKWDYCSPSEGTDYKSNQCDGPCEKKDEEYSWCNLKNGGWGYCGLVSTKMFIYLTRDNYVCIDECQYNEKKDYYWCHTASSWDYCSPDVGVTYKGESCRSDHSCGLHGYRYNWCWTSASTYDYCGPIVSGECTYITSKHSKKRDIDDRAVTCTKKDKITTFTAVPAPNDIADGSKWKKETEILISRWENDHLVDEARSNLIDSESLRIDMQKAVMEKNQLHYYLQVTVKQKAGQSTTLSQIIVTRGISARYIRRAFLLSFGRRAQVRVLPPNELK